MSNLEQETYYQERPSSTLHTLGSGLDMVGPLKEPDQPLE